MGRNWRGRRGELDLIAVTPGNEVVFVEVKTTLRRPEDGWSRIDAAKEHHLAATGLEYLHAHGLDSRTPHRFDVVLVLGDPRSLKRRLRLLWTRGVM